MSSGVKYIMMDGTFKVAPHGFMQMYTIHGGFGEGIHFTMFYVVMKKRRVGDYERVFNRLQSFCVHEFNFSLFNEKRTVITDYETAVFAALKPYKCNMQVCLFHFTQCVYRKVKPFGLADVYNKHKSTVNIYVRLLMMMAFIKPDLKQGAFDDLVRSFSAENVDDGIRHKMAMVFSYFKNTWLRGKIVNLWYFSGWSMNTTTSASLSIQDSLPPSTI